MGGVIVLDLFSWHTFRRIISQTVLRSLGFGLPFRTSGSQSDLFCACGWKYIALEYWGSSALHKDVWDTYPHDSTGQDTLTLGAGQPVDGDLWSQWVLLQGRFRQIRWLSTDNSVSCGTETYSVVYFAYVTDQEKLSWLVLLRKASKRNVILAASLTAATPPTPWQQQRGSPAGAPVVQNSPPPMANLAASPWASGFAYANEMLWCILSRASISIQCYPVPCTWHRSVWRELYCAM